MTECSVKDCKKVTKARGLCMAHYQAERRKGSVKKFTEVTEVTVNNLQGFTDAEVVAELRAEIQELREKVEFQALQIKLITKMPTIQREGVAMAQARAKAKREEPIPEISEDRSEPDEGKYADMDHHSEPTDGGITPEILSEV